ncbi:MAG: sigma-70 family RNA polymerase sigma factor [Clostridia bacterium]|nr:sigma-70 family RNA polymerase sigma factor [Clostridia bacterium]
MRSSTPTDAAIIELYFARDEEAIKKTDEKYGKLCMQTSMNILNSRPDAEECVSDTYLKTWNSIPPTRPASLCTFILRIIRNLSLNRLRDMKAARRNRDLTVSLEELEDCIPMPDEQSPALAALLEDFLLRQDATDRALFMGRYWYACSVSDLAKRTGMTANAVSIRLHKTRGKLRAYLEERGYSV